MINSKQPELKKLSTDWRLTIFGQPIHTPKDMLPMDHPDSPHFHRWKQEKKENKK